MDTFKNCQRPTHTFQTIPILAHVYLMGGQVLEKCSSLLAGLLFKFIILLFSPLLAFQHCLLACLVRSSWLSCLLFKLALCLDVQHVILLAVSVSSLVCCPSLLYVLLAIVVCSLSCCSRLFLPFVLVWYFACCPSLSSCFLVCCPSLLPCLPPLSPQFIILLALPIGSLAFVPVFLDHACHLS